MKLFCKRSILLNTSFAILAAFPCHLSAQASPTQPDARALKSGVASPSLPSVQSSESAVSVQARWEPTFKPNSNLSVSHFISRERAAGRPKKGRELLYTNLQTLGAYEDAEQSGANFADISRERMVWVVKTYYARLETGDGVWDNATVTSVLDAETGQQVTQEIVGTMIKDYRFEGSRMRGEAPKFKSRPLPPTVF
jgi:hypothetical protein